MGNKVRQVKGSGKLTPEQRNEAVALYLSGRTLNSLGKQFGIQAKGVRGLVLARGYSIRPYVPPELRRRKFPASPVPVHERWATRKVETAISNGSLVRPDSCSVCGKSGKVHGHHDDYGKPLDVRWLCPPCHRDWHSLNIPIPSGLE